MMAIDSPARKKFQKWWTKYRRHPDLKYAAYVRGPAMDAFEAGMEYERRVMALGEPAEAPIKFCGLAKPDISSSKRR